MARQQKPCAVSMERTLPGRRPEGQVSCFKARLVRTAYYRPGRLGTLCLSAISPEVSKPFPEGGSRQVGIGVSSSVALA